MSPDTFRLILAVCAIFATFGFLAAFTPLLALIALICGALWLIAIGVRWGWKRWH